MLSVVAAEAHGDGLEVMLEVVSTWREDELRSSPRLRDRRRLGPRRHACRRRPAGDPFDRQRATARSRPIDGHPSVLLGEIDEIAASARELTALDGVYGLDLLAYRHPTGRHRPDPRRSGPPPAP